MFTKKRKVWFIILIFLITASYFLIPQISNYFKWKKAIEASGGFPYQIGLTNAIIIQCALSCNGACCSGGTLCYLKPVSNPSDPQDICINNSDVSGTPAGGMGSNAVFLNTAIGQAGLTSGGQLIAGGMGPTLMNNGVLASVGGCYGCYAKIEKLKDKIGNWFDYIIAGFKD